MAVEKFYASVEARRVLDDIWKQAWLKGRCWGPKRANNPYSATNITIAIGKELVSVSETGDGVVRVHEFTKSENTALGKRIRKILLERGLLK